MLFDYLTQVVFMSNVVLELASKYQTETLLDLGSGKAYLSQVVAAQAQQPDMKVLAVDSSSTNSNSATKRSQKLEVGVFSFSFHIESHVQRNLYPSGILSVLNSCTNNNTTRTRILPFILWCPIKMRFFHQN